MRQRATGRDRNLGACRTGRVAPHGPRGSTLSKPYETFVEPPQHAHYTKRRKEVWEALHPWDNKSISYEERAAELEVAQLDAGPSPEYGLESYDGEEMGEPSCTTHPETDALGRKKSPQQVQSFAAATAEVTGESKAQTKIS